jgi:redox-sensitive bicupin YhaK (pirin superfamily)
MSPSDRSAALVKPFVFLDRFEWSGAAAAGPSLEMGWHPHSGIATVTVVLDGSARYAETTGNAGTLPAGGVEWMRAGGGVWHTGGLGDVPIRGFQLWVALPPELENSRSESHYVMPDEVPRHGPVRVVLGSYGDSTSPVHAPPMTYLSVALADGEAWTFNPPMGHDVAWVAVMDGELRTPEPIASGELAVFDAGEAPIDFVARGRTRFVLGAAPRHAFDLFLGSYSVHTSREALARGEAEIRRIGRTLLAEGKRSYALRMLG